MRVLSALALSLSLAAPASAGVKETLSDHILPGFARFGAASDALAKVAEADCTAPALRPALQETFDAWMAIGDLRIGPSETGALSIAFWPDTRGFTPRTLRRLIAEEDPVAGDAAAYAEVSIAARGLFALEMLLFDPELSTYKAGSYTCLLAATLAADLGNQARDLKSGWSETFAETLLTAGEAGNATYLTQAEATQALYTQILAGLEFTQARRLGAPLGTFERPRPARAEARRSARSLRNVVLAAEAAHSLATAFADWEIPVTDAAFARVLEVADAIEDPAFQDIRDPSSRLRAEILQQSVHALSEAIQAEIGAPLGISAGFNSQDGD
ncbi:imelysin family protein [Pacificoceanicola onchidii]|uniref:imelysin family protein n=1 Tax=Pacificoceanicola onchidii TaxID=2562685 RepID=UPI0010A424B4|nr:imelysin family protein [Pacificoceanicola onchidii]